MLRVRQGLILITLLLAAAPAFAGHGKAKLEGTVIGASGSTLTVQADKHLEGTFGVLIQSSTEVTGWGRGSKKSRKSSRGGPGYRAVALGDRVKVDGIWLDDGRILATRLQLKGRGHLANPVPVPNPGAAALTVHHPLNGQSVSGVVHVQGRTAAYARIRVRARISQPLLPGVEVVTRTFDSHGQADAAGWFSVPVDLGGVPSGSRIDLDVDAGATGVPVRLTVYRS